MKHILTKLLIMTVMITLTFSAAIADDFEDAMQKAEKNLYEAMGKNNETSILKARGQFERILQLKKDVWLVNYYIALADYGLAITGSATNDTKKIQQYTQSGISTLQKSIDENPDFAESYILMKGLNFNRWMYEQEKMQDIINATESADAQAKKLEANNPRYVLFSGISTFWTPEAFGGGAAKSVTDFEKSLELFSTRKEKSELYPNWGEDLAYGYLAMALAKRDDDGDLKKANELLSEGSKKFPESGFISVFAKDEVGKAEKD